MACSEHTLIKAGLYFTLTCLVVLHAMLVWYSISLLLRLPSPHVDPTVPPPGRHKPAPDFKLPAPLQRKADSR